MVYAGSAVTTGDVVGIIGLFVFGFIAAWLLLAWLLNNFNH